MSGELGSDVLGVRVADLGQDVQSLRPGEPGGRLIAERLMRVGDVDEDDRALVGVMERA